jgi:hypothetical protein
MMHDEYNVKLKEWEFAGSRICECHRVPGETYVKAIYPVMIP